MTTAAQLVAEELIERIGIDGVFVLLIRKSDDTMGAAVAGSKVEFDVLVGCTVEMLGHLRPQFTKGK